MEANKLTRLRGMLGFAMRAGRVVVGTDQVCLAMKKNGGGRVRIALVASDASPSTRKKIHTKGEFYGIKTADIDIDTATLGGLLGKTYAPAAVGICDDGFAKEIGMALSCDDSSTTGNTKERKFSERETGDSNDV